MIPKSKLYKVIHSGIVVAEGSKSEMKKAIKRFQNIDTSVFTGPQPFIGISPELSIGDKWGKIAYWN